MLFNEMKITISGSKSVILFNTGCKCGSVVVVDHQSIAGLDKIYETKHPEKI